MYYVYLYFKVPLIYGARPLGGQLSPFIEIFKPVCVSQSICVFLTDSQSLVRWFVLT